MEYEDEEGLKRAMSDVRVAYFFLSLPPVASFDQTLAPGSFSLNLRNVSAEDAQVFFAAVSDLVPKCVNVPITTSSLAEEFKFSPKKVRHCSKA